MFEEKHDCIDESVYEIAVGRAVGKRYHENKKATYVYQTNPLKGIFLDLFTDFD